MIRDFIKKTFDLRDGEIYISFLMQLYIFLIISVLLIVKPTVNALFLSNLGADHLPYGYLAVAVVAILTSYFYNNIIRRSSIKLIAIISLIGFSISFIFLFFLLYFKIINSWVLYIFYINVSIFAVLTTSQFWIFANLVYNVREAKRLFGFIGAGAIAGGIFGGYLTSILAPIIGNQGLIAIAAILILGCVPILQSVWKIRVKKLNIYVRKQLRESNRNASYRSSFKLITNSKHLTYLASIVGIGVIMAKLVDFQFSDFANRAIPDSDELASFFGFWFSSFNVVALILQLFFTNRILSYVGVTSTLLILPLSIALGCLLFLTFPELWVLVIIKGMDGSFKQSLNKAAIELSILPIPFSIKNQAKSYIDVVVDSIATGIAGFLLIFVIKKLDLSTSYITIIILLLLFIWMLLIYQLREAYFNSFRMNLQNSLQQHEDTKSKISRETTLASAHRILDHGSAEEILKLLERLSSYRMKSLKDSIISLLDHSDLKIVAAAIPHLYSYNRGTAVDKVERLITEEDDEVVVSAMEYLLTHTNLKDSEIFNSYLDHENRYISHAALLCLAKASYTNEKTRIKYKLTDRMEGMVKEFEEGIMRKPEIAELMIAIAYAGMSGFYHIIQMHLEHDDVYLRKHAIKAAGISKDPEFINTLIESLALKAYRKRAIKALKNYGSRIIQTITQLEKNELLNDSSRRFVPKVIKEFKTQDAVKTLLSLLKSKDHLIRLEASKSLLKLKKTDASLRFHSRKILVAISKEIQFYKNSVRAIAILGEKQDIYDKTTEESEIIDTKRYKAREEIIDLLKIQQDCSLACIFKLLSLRYDEKDMTVVHSGLLSPEKEARMHALEFLDNLLHAKLKTNILPILEYQSVSPASYDIANLRLKIISEKQCLLLLLKNRGKKMKLVVLKYIQYLDDKDYARLLKFLRNHKSPEVQQLTASIIDKKSA